MPICGLVVTLDTNPLNAERAMRAICDNPAITVGQNNGLRLPIATDTKTRQEDNELWNWLNGLDGVCHVDVVYAHIGDPGDSPVTGKACTS